MGANTATRPAIPWRLEVALAAGLLAVLSGALVIELRGDPKAADRSSTQGRLAGEEGGSRSERAPLRREDAPKVGLVFASSSDGTLADLRKALKAIDQDAVPVPINQFKAMGRDELGGFDILFLVSKDNLEINMFIYAVDLARKLAEFANRGGIVVATTSWSPVIFFDPFRDFNQALGYPVLWGFDGRNTIADCGRMARLGHAGSDHLYWVGLGDIGLKEYRNHKWSFQGQRTPRIESLSLKAIGIDVHCFAYSNLKLPVLVSKEMGRGRIFYSALGNYDQDDLARETLRRVVGAGIPGRSTGTVGATGTREARPGR